MCIRDREYPEAVTVYVLVLLSGRSAVVLYRNYFCLGTRIMQSQFICGMRFDASVILFTCKCCA